MIKDHSQLLSSYKNQEPRSGKTKRERKMQGKSIALIYYYLKCDFISKTNRYGGGGGLGKVQNMQDPFLERTFRGHKEAVQAYSQ
jgi:hypothetical protein